MVNGPRFQPLSFIESCESALGPCSKTTRSHLRSALGPKYGSISERHNSSAINNAFTTLLQALRKLNIDDATLYPGLDGFSRSLNAAVEIQERENWPRVSQATDREAWVKEE